MCGDLVVWASLGNVGASVLTAGATIELFSVIDGVETLLDAVMVAEPLLEGNFTAAFVFEVMNAPTIDSLIFRVSTPTWSATSRTTRSR